MNKNNRKAPRFSLRSIRGLGDSNFMKRFFKACPEYKKIVSAKLFTSIIMAFNRHFYRAVIENRYGAEIPEGLGKVQMKSYKTGNDFIDVRSYATGKLIKARNLHTDGKALKICYSNSEKNHNFVNRDLWYFDPCREFSQEASKAFMVDWNKYVYVDGSERMVAKRAAKNKARNYAEKKMDDFLLTYDEFAF